MDNQGNVPLSLAHYYQGKTMEELRQSLLFTTLELEATRLAAQEEIRKRDEQMIHLEDLLNRAITEKNEAQEKCHRLVMDKLVLLQQPQQQTTPLSGMSSIEDEQRRGGGGDSNTAISSSDCEESIVSSPVAVDLFHSEMLKGVPEKPLPEKGKLLQAVMKAGPLLQTLLLAGPLPQWQHPPPPLNFFERPPVISPSSPHFLYHHDSSFVNITSTNKENSHGSFPNKKRSLVIGDGSDISSKNPKYQSSALH
ncbi:hypothetical protein MKW92_047874 [Papaver armeniacum]|nr:hypothetical protein MKW92_047874 [Papaver armeniacum]